MTIPSSRSKVLLDWVTMSSLTPRGVREVILYWFAGEICFIFSANDKITEFCGRPHLGIPAWYERPPISVLCGGGVSPKPVNQCHCTSNDDGQSFETGWGESKSFNPHVWHHTHLDYRVIGTLSLVLAAVSLSLVLRPRHTNQGPVQRTWTKS